MSTSSHLARKGDALFSKTEKVNAELFTMTYGAIVAQLVNDLNDVTAVNEALEKMGYNIGIRICDEFLAKSTLATCTSLQETAQIIAKVAFKMFLGVAASVSDWSEDQKEFSLELKSNPLEDFVEIPESHAGLRYCNMLCGIIRGAMEMIQLRVECSIIQDALIGEDATVIRVCLKEVLHQTVLQDDEL
eukprot:86036_1